MYANFIFEFFAKSDKNILQRIFFLISTKLQFPASFLYKAIKAITVIYMRAQKAFKT